MMDYIATFINLFCLFAFGVCNVAEFFTREKCMEELGCFYAGSPFFDIIERPLSLLPDDRESIDTHFYMFTRENQSPSLAFRNFDSSMEDFSKSGFNPHMETKFIIAGFMSRHAEHWKLPMVNLLLKNRECNVVLVDWRGGDGPLYEQAVANTRIVGAEIAQFIKKIQKKTGISLASIHLIGHSLGSHIAGYTGKILKKIGRITALDPAGPYFTNVDPIVRLDRSDATFVDAIHTNAAPSRLQGFGLTESVAHFDFWLNGGHVQPGCPDMSSSILSFLSNPTFEYEGGLHDIMCNHVRAIHVFLSTMQHPECKLIGYVCDSWDDYVDGSCNKKNNGHPKRITMGLESDRFVNYVEINKYLNIYLNTTSEAPYCIGVKVL